MQPELPPFCTIQATDWSRQRCVRCVAILSAEGERTKAKTMDYGVMHLQILQGKDTKQSVDE